MEISKGYIKTVAIAGHFNPLHPGHLKLIADALTYGDRLVVIVANDDQAEIKRSKVFMSATDRMLMVAAIKGVDGVFKSIDTDTNVCQSLRYLIPDVFCSGCGPDHPDAIEEQKVCDALGIKTVYNVGGEKIQSSSKLLHDYTN
jgi:cytidyltransferase-like protein